MRDMIKKIEEFLKYILFNCRGRNIYVNRSESDVLIFDWDGLAPTSTLDIFGSDNFSTALSNIVDDTEGTILIEDNGKMERFWYKNGEVTCVETLKKKRDGSRLELFFEITDREFDYIDSAAEILCAENNCVKFDIYDEKRGKHWEVHYDNLQAYLEEKIQHGHSPCANYSGVIDDVMYHFSFCTSLDEEIWIKHFNRGRSTDDTALRCLVSRILDQVPMKCYLCIVVSTCGGSANAAIEKIAPIIQREVLIYLKNRLCFGLNLNYSGLTLDDMLKNKRWSSFSFACLALRFCAIAFQDGTSNPTAYSPLFLYGGNEQMKRALKNSFEIEIRRQNPNFRVFNIFTETDVQDFIDGEYWSQCVIIPDVSLFEQLPEKEQMDLAERFRFIKDLSIVVAFSKNKLREMEIIDSLKAALKGLEINMDEE